jgi:ribosomal protein S18 acetylase RimI-like enzyme
VRPAQTADSAELARLAASVEVAGGMSRAVQGADLDQLTHRFAELATDDQRTLLVAVDEVSSEIIGLLVARPDEIGGIELAPVLHVTHLIVAPGQRRRGIGRALLAESVHIADERGYDRIVATAGAGSREANRYLARLGFAPMVVHRVATVAALRRSLGIVDAPQRIAILRRAKLQRIGQGTRAIRGA